MRLILYISKAEGGFDAPYDFVKILKESRSFNTKKKITGVISYCKGYYLQLIEGDFDNGVDVVSSLYQKIERDDRHASVKKILDIETSKRYFERCPMKVFIPFKDSFLFDVFLKDYFALIGNVDESDRAILLNFFRFPRDENLQKKIANAVFSEAMLSEYAHCSLRLMSWPNFVSLKVKPHREVLYACTSMMSKHVVYEELKKCFSQQNRGELENFLLAMDKAGLLSKKITQAHHSSQSHVPSVSSRKKEGKFFSKVKEFLTKKPLRSK